MQTTLGRSGLIALALSFGLTAACNEVSQASRTDRSSDASVVARIGDKEITLDQVDEKALASNMKAYQELYNVRRQALETLIEEELLREEARARGMTEEELVAAEITPKIASVTDEDVEAFFDQNRARLGGQTLEQIGGQIREFLQARNETLARQAYLGELREDASVRVALDPPRVPVEVADNEPVKGPPDAEVTIVEYSDFQ